MKTLMMFDVAYSEKVVFFELIGDFTHLNDVYIEGSSSKKLQEELLDLVYDEEGVLKLEELEVPTKDWSIFIKCGYL